MAEREGFEPSVEVSPHTRLAGEHLRPLGHLSGKASLRTMAASGPFYVRLSCYIPKLGDQMAEGERFELPKRTFFSHNLRYLFFALFHLKMLTFKPGFSIVGKEQAL